MFEDYQPDPQWPERDDLIFKSADDLPADAAGAVGLKSDQKRTVHVHSVGRLREDGLKEISVQCIQPAGSRFVFLSDDSADAGGDERAPNGLTYLSAGVAFCFMTQLGRYAQIAKQDLQAYRIVQDTTFGLCRDYDPSALPVETLVCLEIGEDDDKCAQAGPHGRTRPATCMVPIDWKRRWKSAGETSSGGCWRATRRISAGNAARTC